MAKRISVSGMGATPRRSMMHSSAYNTPRQNLGAPPPPPTSYDLPSHALLDQSGLACPTLDFTGLTQRMRSFTENLERWSIKTIADFEDEKKEMAKMREENERKLSAKETQIQEVKAEQKSLFETVQAEREADALKRKGLAQIQADLHSLETTTASVAAELEAAQRRLDARQAERRADEAKLDSQRARNRPELAMLETLTGLRVEPAADGEEVIRFDWRLIDPADWDNQASLTLGFATKEYKILFMLPKLPDAPVAAALAELQSGRNLWAFTKQIRALFALEFERKENERKLNGAI